MQSFINTRTHTRNENQRSCHQYDEQHKLDGLAHLINDGLYFLDGNVELNNGERRHDIEKLAHTVLFIRFKIKAGEQGIGKSLQ